MRLAGYMAKQKLGTESCKEAAGNEDKQPWSLQVDCKHVYISASASKK
jgi:hypothetical protein